MADVEFSEEQSYARGATGPRVSPLVGLIMRTGLAKDQRSAEYVLVGIGVGAVCLTAAIWLFGSSGATTAPLGPSEQTVVPGADGAPAGNLRDLL